MRRVLRRASLAWLPPLIATAYNLVVLRGQLVVVPAGNDSAVHIAYARWVAQQLHAGRIPLDGWYANLQLGVAAARHYQIFPDLVTGIVAAPLGVERTYRLLLYVLLATWPISVFLGARWLGWGWPASIAALVSPFITSITSYGYEHSSYTWQGYGLYTQLWGMWLMPLAWGLTWQAIDRGRHLVWAAVALGLLVCSHFLSGYLAALLLPVWVISTPPRLLARLARAGLVAFGAAAVAAWAVVPVLIDHAYTPDSQFLQGTFWQNSFGAATVVGWLAGGQLLDSGRWAIVTAAAAVGFAVALVRFRSDGRARALIGALLLSLILFSGRPTFAALIDLLPGNQDLLLHRYLIGVQLAAIILAGIGFVHAGRWLDRTIKRRLQSLRPRRAVRIAMAAGLVAALFPAAIQVAAADGRFDTVAGIQLAAERADGADVRGLLNLARDQGRIYAGGNADWGRLFRVGYLPVSVELLNNDADGIGFTPGLPSLAQDAEAHFDNRNLAQYQLFDVAYLLMPAGVLPPVPAEPVATRGRAAIWKVNSGGYLQVVDVVAPNVVADRHDLGRKGEAFLASSDLRNARYHAVAFDGTAASPIFSAASVNPTASPAGSVEAESQSTIDGAFYGRVYANHAAVVLVKTSFDPNWQVTVDGSRRPSMMLLPGLLGVQVPAGQHVVTISYKGFGGFLPLFLLCALGLIFVWRVAPIIERSPKSVAPATKLSGNG